MKPVLPALTVVLLISGNPAIAQAEQPPSWTTGDERALSARQAEIFTRLAELTAQPEFTQLERRALDNELRRLFNGLVPREEQERPQLARDIVTVVKKRETQKALLRARIQDTKGRTQSQRTEDVDTLGQLLHEEREEVAAVSRDPSLLRTLQHVPEGRGDEHAEAAVGAPEESPNRSESVVAPAPYTRLGNPGAPRIDVRQGNPGAPRADWNLRNPGAPVVPIPGRAEDLCNLLASRREAVAQVELRGLAASSLPCSLPRAAGPSGLLGDCMPAILALGNPAGGPGTAAPSTAGCRRGATTTLVSVIRNAPALTVLDVPAIPEPNAATVLVPDVGADSAAPVGPNPNDEDGGATARSDEIAAREAEQAAERNSRDEEQHRESEQYESGVEQLIATSMAEHDAAVAAEQRAQDVRDDATPEPTPEPAPAPEPTAAPPAPTPLRPPESDDIEDVDEGVEEDTTPVPTAGEPLEQSVTTDEPAVNPHVDPRIDAGYTDSDIYREDHPAEFAAPPPPGDLV